jgi:hypothetical protein
MAVGKQMTHSHYLNGLTDLTIAGNTVFGNREGIRVRNGWQHPFDPNDDGASDNRLDVLIKDNIVTGTVGEGLLLSAGGSGVANTNDVEVTVKKNIVCGSAATDVHAIGGLLGIPSLLPPNQGTGNTIGGEITKNTATTVVVENGVAGNSATVTQFKNTPCP